MTQLKLPTHFLADARHLTISSARLLAQSAGLLVRSAGLLAQSVGLLVRDYYFNGVKVLMVSQGGVNGVNRCGPSRASRRYAPR